MDPLDPVDPLDRVEPVDPVLPLAQLDLVGGSPPPLQRTRAARWPAAFVKNFLWAWPARIED